MAIPDLKQTPRVSVVIPTRNRAALLRRALESVRAQRGIDPADVEVIVVDDASMDDTPSVVAAFSARYLRTARPCGGAAARNMGIAAAHGEVVAFLDDDDEWHPDKLALQLEVMRRTGADLCATGFRMVDCRRRTLRVYRGRDYRSNQAALRRLAHDNFIGTASSVAVRTAVLRQVGGFDEVFAACQDYELWLRIVAAGYRVRFIRQPLVIYHYHAGQRISVSPAAVRGYRQFVHKFRALIDRYGLRRYHLHEMLYRSAKAALFAGDQRGFYRNLRRAIRVYPWVPRHTALFFMAPCADILRLFGMVK